MSKELEYFQEIIKVDEEALALANKEKSKKIDVMLHRHWLNIRKNSIEQALKDKEKKDKALEIITRELNVKIEEDKGAYFICIMGWYFEIPKEEYDSLKEVLI